MNHKTVAFAVIAALTLSFLAMSGNACAEDKLVNTKADNVVIAKGKNNADYVRVTITEDRKVGGIEYRSPMQILFFGALVEKAKTIKAGQNVKCVVSVREYQGRTSYTAVALPQ